MEKIKNQKFNDWLVETYTPKDTVKRTQLIDVHAMDKLVTPLAVEVITTFETAITPQQKKKFERLVGGHVITPNQLILTIAMEVPPVEFFVLANIITRLKKSKIPMKNLIKFSLAYHFYDSTIADDHKQWGWGFIHRTNGKYFFQPDQRDDFEEFLVERFGIASLTKPYHDGAFTDKPPLEEIGLEGSIKGIAQADHHDELQLSFGPYSELKTKKTKH